jgi:hypothetical protein
MEHHYSFQPIRRGFRMVFFTNDSNMLLKTSEIQVSFFADVRHRLIPFSLAKALIRVSIDSSNRSVARSCFVIAITTGVMSCALAKDLLTFAFSYNLDSTPLSASIAGHVIMTPWDSAIALSMRGWKQSSPAVSIISTRYRRPS